MNKAEFSDILASSNKWTKDLYNHYKRIVKDSDGTDKVFRLKMKTNSVSLEKRIVSADGNYWLKLTGCYYKDITMVRESVYRLGKSVIKIVV